jgi:DTW domain-containing protein YfiP
MANEMPERARRERCYACFRPRAECLCDTLPRIENRTPILVLQHRRESFHAFNTARMVRHSLANSRFVVGHVREIAEQLVLESEAALLFPGETAEVLADLPAERRPRQLVVVDGTWHQAKTLVRDIPALSALPRVRLRPAEPSRYRIRREPHVEALSTVEAVVDALRTLEPNTPGGDELLTAFRRMVDRQADHPKLESARRSLARQSRTVGNIPIAIARRWEDIVVACGEVAEGGRNATSPTGGAPTDVAASRDDSAQASRPLVWIAERLATGERFVAVARCVPPPSEQFLRHLELPAAAFLAGEPFEEIQRRWRAFCRPNDFLVVFHSGMAKLAENLDGAALRPLILKSVNVPALKPHRDLETVVPALGVPVAEVWHPGRAARRLMLTAALAKQLRDWVRGNVD